jgi:hypothetical protein
LNHNSFWVKFCFRIPKIGEQFLFLSRHVSESECAFNQQPIRTKRNLKRSWEDEREQEAYNFLKVAADHLTNIDELSVFVQMVASQLRKLNRRNQAIAKKLHSELSL